MPSGNATLTYTGDEPSIEIQGETFTKDTPQVTHDNGIIAAVSERDDFEIGDHVKPAKAKKAKG